MRGKLEVQITANRRDRSFISRMNYTFPLKILRPFYLDGIGTAFIYVLDTSGGMLSGDSLDYRVRVNEGAHLYLTNASASKCYVMPEGDARVRQYFAVGRNASLEFFPEEVMLFKSSSMESFTRIDADRDSVFAFCEMYAGGRKHTGELFQFRSIGNRFEITIDGKLAIWEQYRLDGDKRHLGRNGYLEQSTHWGTLYLYSNETSADMLQRVQECLTGINLNAIRAGCSLHPSGVITVKAISTQYEAVKDCFQQVWSSLRPSMLKEELPYVRK